MKSLTQPAILVCLSTLFLASTAAHAQRTTNPRAVAPARTAQAQAPGASAAAAAPVAVVDIGFIFKHHGRFNAVMQSMKEEVQAYEETIKQRQQELGKQRDQMTRYKPGSPEFQKYEKALAEAAAQLQVETQLKKKEFLEREAKVYYQVYMEVLGAIRGFADANGISLVLRHNGEQIDPQDRGSVLQGVNRAVVYHRNLDITREVLDRLNRTQPQRTTAAPNTTPRARR